MNDNNAPPLRAHDWILENGRLARNKREMVLLPTHSHRQQRHLRLRLGRAGSQLEDEATQSDYEPVPISELEPEPAPKPVVPPREPVSPALTHDRIVGQVVKLMSHGHSYSTAMEMALDELEQPTH